jgi:hypothetical protein
VAAGRWAFGQLGPSRPLPRLRLFKGSRWL